MAGGQAQLARLIRARMPNSKVGQVHVWGWLEKVKIEVPPAEVVLAIAEGLAWRITPHELRADLYPNPGDALPEGVATPSSTPRPARQQHPASGAGQMNDGISAASMSAATATAVAMSAGSGAGVPRTTVEPAVQGAA